MVGEETDTKEEVRVESINKFYVLGGYCVFLH